VVAWWYAMRKVSNCVRLRRSGDPPMTLYVALHIRPVGLFEGRRWGVARRRNEDTAEQNGKQKAAPRRQAVIHLSAVCKSTETTTSPSSTAFPSGDSSKPYRLLPSDSLLRRRLRNWKTEKTARRAATCQRQQVPPPP
jgi:hypothetical protein